MQHEPTVRIPLRDKTGQVVAHTLIDAVDAEAVNRYRWCLTTDGYVRRNDRKRYVRLHRVLLGLATGDPRHVDHINGDPLDNRRTNLRIVTRSQNAQNVRSHRDSTSRYRGVSWNRDCRKWQAHAYVDGRSRYLGLFVREKDAAEAARAFRAQHMTHAA